MRPKNEHKNSVITIEKNTYIVKQKPNKYKPIISVSYSAWGQDLINITLTQL